MSEAAVGIILTYDGNPDNPFEEAGIKCARAVALQHILSIDHGNFAIKMLTLRVNCED